MLEGMHKYILKSDSLTLCNVIFPRHSLCSYNVKYKQTGIFSYITWESCLRWRWISATVLRGRSPRKNAIQDIFVYVYVYLLLHSIIAIRPSVFEHIQTCRSWTRAAGRCAAFSNDSCLDPCHVCLCTSSSIPQASFDSHEFHFRSSDNSKCLCWTIQTVSVVDSLSLVSSRKRELPHSSSFDLSSNRTIYPWNNLPREMNYLRLNDFYYCPSNFKLFKIFSKLRIYYVFYCVFIFQLLSLSFIN